MPLPLVIRLRSASQSSFLPRCQRKLRRVVGRLSVLLTVLGCHAAIIPRTDPPTLGADRQPDPRLRSLLSRIDGDGREVLLVTRATGRVRGSGLRVRADSVVVANAEIPRSMPMVDIDSLWVRRSAASVVGVVVGLPCAIFGGLVGEFIATDPDGNAGGNGAAGFLIGAAAGGSVCGLIGAGLGSLIPRWHLRYARR